MNDERQASCDGEELGEILLLGSCGASQIQQALDALRRASVQVKDFTPFRALRPFTLAGLKLRKNFEDRADEGAAFRTQRLLNELDLQLGMGLATWDDLYHLEKLVLEVSSEDELRRRKIELITEFNLYAGPILKAKYESYSAGLNQQPFPESCFDSGKISPKEPFKEPITAKSLHVTLSCETLRHECLFLQHLVHEILTVRPHQERKRIDINMILLSSSAAFILFFGLIGLLFRQTLSDAQFPFTIFILWAGIIGACVSSLIRLQDSAKEGQMILNTTRYARGMGAYFPSILLGAGAGLLSYLILLAGFGTITLSPPAPSASDTFAHFWVNGPQAAMDQAKAVVIAFAAGFLERFVPDTIDHVPGMGVKRR